MKAKKTESICLRNSGNANMLKLIEQLKRHEGFRAMPYRCSAGKLTIGYGRNLDDQPLSGDELRLLGKDSQKEVIEQGISQADAELLLTMEVQKLDKALALKFGWYKELDPARQGVLIDMAYNLGLNGLFKWKNTLRYIQEGSYQAAAKNMRHSLWASQVKDRATTLCRQMETGLWR